MTQPPRAPTRAEIAALPTPVEAAAIPSRDERAKTIGHAAGLLYRYVTDQFSRRAETALALKEQHGWPPVRIYTMLDVPRRTYTNWWQRAQELDRTAAAMSEDAARRGTLAAHKEIQHWQPVLDEYTQMRTEMYRELLSAGVPDRTIRQLLGIARNPGRIERRRAIGDGVKPPTRVPTSTRVKLLVAERIRNGVYDGKLPSENKLAHELTAAWGVPVSRAAVTLAYGKLADDGVIASQPKVGWFVRYEDQDAKRAESAPADTAACM